MTQRMEQINSVFQKDIAEFTVKHAQSAAYLITITYVLINADLSNAKVGVTTFPASKKNVEIAIKQMNRTRSELQFKLARSHRLKTIPTLEFVPDLDAHKVVKIDELLDKVERERR